MGVRLVGLALAPDWSVLSDRARLVLVHMAYTAKDSTSNGHAAGTFWAGHSALIVGVLGLDPDSLSGPELEAAQHKIKRAIQELKQAGAITLTSTATRGRTAVYRVHPDRFPGVYEPVDNSTCVATGWKEKGAIQ